MEMPLLTDIVIILGLSVIVVFLFQRIRLPSILGFLLSGIIAGPQGLGLVKATHDIQFLAELGVILLLFAIGIEFSLKNLLRIRKSALLGGSLQVLLTILVSSILVRQTGLSLEQSIFTGFLISLSSTAIVLKLLQERAEIDSPHGRTALGILIFQDVIIVPMILVTPILAGASGSVEQSFLLLGVKSILIIFLVFISAKWIVPRILYQIARTRSRELFLLSIVVICFTVAWLTSSAGLSLALGAFLAGLIISESEYSHQAFGNILPFRDLFSSFFFVSIGMLVDISFIFSQLWLTVLVVLGVIILKALLAGSATFLLGFPLRTSILVGLAISQVGEFSFILSETGIEHGLLSGEVYQLFLAISVLSMASTPFIIAFAPRIADIVLQLPLPKTVKSRFYPPSEAKAVDKKNHLIIIGFGVNGRNVAHVSKLADIPYVIIEMNPETVKSEQAKGEPIFFGDATQEGILQQAGIKEAMLVVVTIDDPPATRRITEIARRLNPKGYLIIRTRYLQEMKPLYQLGANEVIPEEFETSVEIFTRVLMKYLVPKDQIERLVSEIRADGYQMFRTLSGESVSFCDFKLQLPDVEISILKVGEKSPLTGKSLAQTGLRSKYGVTVLAIRRESQILANPSGDTELCARDMLFVLASPDKITGVTGLF